MPSLRQKVTTYFRQLSFIADSRDGPRSPRKTEEDEGGFITKYLEGRMERIFVPGPEVSNGQNPSDMPQLALSSYPTGAHTITSACTGPDDGLTGIKRSKLHLSAGSDIDFIDTIQDNDAMEVRKSISNHNKFKFNASKYRSDQNANKVAVSGGGGIGGSVIANTRSRRNSKVEQSGTTTNCENNAKGGTTIVVSMVSTTKSNTASQNGTTNTNALTTDEEQSNNKNIVNAKTDFKGISKGHNGIIKTPTTTISTSSPLIDDSKPQKTEKKLDDSSRLLREAVSNQALVMENGSVVEPIAGVTNWKMESESAYGISVSLYENNMLTKEPMGNPIADCYGMVVRGNAAAMALADGVNWGDGARLAARSAVHGCLDYLDRAVFGMAQECIATNTTEVFVSLLRSLWEGHGCILEVGGALSTLTIAVVLPLAEENLGKYVVCACNVGDSLGYVYSKKHGVREFTQACHDIHSMRDMRDALGALGPADGNKPELSNLTLSMTVVDAGDIVFLTSDGISDNFDPVVGKFAEAWTPESKISKYESQRSLGVLAPKRQNKSASAIYSRLHRGEPTTNKMSCSMNAGQSTIPSRPPRSKKSSSPENVAPRGQLEKSSSVSSVPSRPKYMRSHTVIESRAQQTQPIVKVPKSILGLPLVTGPQRHALTLYRLEDLLSYGTSGTFCPCSSARRLCHLLIDFVRMITTARRKTLEQRELFYKLATSPDGIKREVELNRMQHRAARKRVVDSSAFSSLPGKLDHATVVAYTIGSGLQSKEFQETNF
ncbi:PP2C-like domain-containing protein CG9801 [Eupeodes corollae]|uniref:PP2C-like domain-containing protein CG9801 n=1 Tax=Eupeodes corollae TaxID=290404 RepID=UPI002492E7C5|nr:PP2C-like domain-containing protein CG9801 [Eupeodes corollae]XP_055922069.1 PP2C-like domain-containing protein CG9801 [Eupeodes corollae]